tara:strand:- start:6555 stop:7523 length:969 start_codon:yes stop_codon:yes gene_type:complete
MTTLYLELMEKVARAEPTTKGKWSTGEKATNILAGSVASLPAGLAQLGAAKTLLGRLEKDTKKAPTLNKRQLGKLYKELGLKGVRITPSGGLASKIDSPRYYPKSKFTDWQRRALLGESGPLKETVKVPFKGDAGKHPSKGTPAGPKTSWNAYLRDLEKTLDPEGYKRRKAQAARTPEQHRQHLRKRRYGAALTAHELGHASLRRNKVLSAIAKGRAPGALLASAAGIQAAFGDPDSSLSKKTPYIQAAGFAPMAIDEAGATYKGLKALKKTKALNPAQYRAARALLLRAGGTYAAAVGGAMGASALTLKARRALKKKQMRD